MKRTVRGITCILALLMLNAATVSAKRKPEAPPVEPLAGEAAVLAEKYSNQLDALRSTLKAALPTVDPQKKAAYLKAVETETLAKEALADVQKLLGKVKKAQGLVGHAKNKWIAGADKGIAKTKAKLKAAKTEAEREAAEKELAKWQQNREDGLQALEERQALLDEALAEEPALLKRQAAAETVLAAAKAKTLKAVQALGFEDVLTSSILDGQLARYVVMSEATPRGLATFAAKGKSQQALIEKLLADEDLMVEILIADGANGGKYGAAMKIYTDIQQASPKAKSGALRRLALGIALEHAVPVGQRNPKAATDAPATVDPVKRYLQYEHAYLNGELDPAFDRLSVWAYRMVVDGSEPDSTLVWGREMLRTYRPDHITTDDYKWRYVAAVRTEIRYGSQYNKYDKPELQFFQNILMNGGVCGRRAFFGRFILRAFGMPTTARPQPGHAALAHWTPDGWAVNLGGGWGAGTTKTRYSDDLDFLATTQARALGDQFIQIKRAQWIGDVMGEPRVFGLRDKADPEIWYGLSLYRQRAMIAEAKVETLAAVGEELGEANESHVKYAFVSPPVTAEDRKISVDDNGVITVPAAACSSPTKSTGKIIFMPSNLGGKQLHYSRTGGPESFTYNVEASSAGKYALSARVACPSWGQLLVVKANAADPIEIELPLTVGLWDNMEAVTIPLVKGKNVLTFSRTGDNIRGLTIKDFTLTPVK